MRDRIYAILLLLGTTADEVAEKLTSLGITGEKRHLCNCPIGRYLSVHNAGWKIEVRLSTIEVNDTWVPIAGWPGLPPLNGLRDFLQAFDAGKYPLLERAGIE